MYMYIRECLFMYGLVYIFVMKNKLYIGIIVGHIFPLAYGIIDSENAAAWT